MRFSICSLSISLTLKFSLLQACMGTAAHRKTIDENDFMASPEFEATLPERLRPAWEARYGENQTGDYVPQFEAWRAVPARL